MNMSDTSKRVLWRFVRIAIAGGITAGIAALVAAISRGEVFIPAWALPLVTGALAALDKWIRDKQNDR